jgi:hypothetical protein
MPVMNLSVAYNADGSPQLFAGLSCQGHSVVARRDGIQPGLLLWFSLSDMTGNARQFALARDANGLIDGFMLNHVGRVIQLTQIAANSASFNMRDIGAIDWNQIAIARNANAQLELFGLVNGNVYHMWETSKNGPWTTSKPFGTQGLEQIAVGTNKGGRLEVFGLAGGNVWHFWQSAPGNWANAHGVSFGTQGLEQIAVATNKDGRLEVFGLAGGNIWHFAQSAPGDWTNAHGVSFGTQGLEQIAVAANENGELEVFGLAAGNVWHFRQSAPGNWANAHGVSFGTNAVTQIVPASLPGGRLEVFVVAGGQVWQFGQTNPNSNVWTGATKLSEQDLEPSTFLEIIPSEINRGQKATLVWHTSSAESVILEPGGEVSTNGSVFVTPASTTTYVLLARAGNCVSTAAAILTVHVPPPPPPPSTTRGLLFQENASYSSGKNTWMFYSATVLASDPLASKSITSVANPTNFDLLLTHEGITVPLSAHGSATFPSAPHMLGGDWSAELVGVKGPFAPTSLQVNVLIA